MTRADYVIVGAGTAGCVLANRLSQDPATTVLLIEAGGEDDDPRIAMPRGFGELLGDPAMAWHYPTRPFGPEQRTEHWVRGRTLGGSSSVNGMVYNRGHRADHDAIAAAGNPGWGWDEMLRVFREIEGSTLGTSPLRGGDGPLRISSAESGEPLMEDVLRAGTELGWQRTQDLNASDDERIGYATATISDGRRCSAADAFLHPVRSRPNLHIALHTEIDQVVVEDGRAVAVRGRRGGRAVEHAADQEVILSAGALATPRILQLSGIGDGDVLDAAGVRPVVDSPHVGARLREHRVMHLQHRLREDVGYNRLLGTPDGRDEAMQEYSRTGGGPLGAPSFDIVGFFRTRPELDRPDAQIQIAPYSIRPLEAGGSMEIEQEPGLIAIGYQLRPNSEGSIRITSDDPRAPLDIDPGYFSSDQDRRTSVAVVRGLRRLLDTAPLAPWIERETSPGRGAHTDRQILEAGLTGGGGAGYHAIGTAAMGPHEEDVVDAQLRVRGVQRLRVVDASVLPTMVSGNLNGPVAALAWRAAALVLDAA